MDIAIAGNFESDGTNEIICPFCGKPSGWSKELWVDNIPDNGLYCNACHVAFVEGDFNYVKS